MKLYKFDKELLLFKRVSLIRFYMVIGVLISLTLLSFIKTSAISYREDVVVLVNNKDLLSEEKVLEEIRKLNIKFPEIVFAQAKLESGNFTSKIYKENNNLFGMRIARLRPTTALNESGGYAVYPDWKSSIIDYALYQSAYLREINTEENYYAYLDSSYADDENYVKKIQQIVGNLKINN